ncbi:MAG: DUF4331 family protein [Gemmatimonadaceae bacterium]
MPRFPLRPVALGLVLASLALAGCNDTETTGLVPSDASNGEMFDDAATYDQVEFLANPLVAEVTVVKANHDGYNQTMPYTSSLYRAETETFIRSFGRSATLATTLGSVLYPDMLIVDPTKEPSSAGWLSWALASGWGGRKLSDDVVDLGLSAIFSTFLDPNNAFCAPFTLPLCTDNIGANDRTFLPSFPYLATPNRS